MINNIANNVLFLSISGTLIIVILLLLKPLYQNKFSNKWYYYVWLIVMVRLIVPFGLPVNLISDVIITKVDHEVATIDEVQDMVVSPIDQPLNTVIQTLPQTETTSTEQNITNVEQTSPITTTVNILDLFQIATPFLGIIWIFVCVFLLAKKLFDYMIFLRLVYSGIKPINDLEVLQSYSDTNLLLGIKKEIPIFTHPIIGSPMLVGFFRPIIILPEKQLENTDGLKYVFMHELTHLKRLDIYYKWLMQIVLCVHWFNPVVYFAIKQADKACELSCDEAVIKRLTQKEQRAYGDTLIRSLELIGAYHNPSGSLTLAENAKLMKERLGNIMKFRKKSKFAVCMSVLLTFMLCTGAAFTGVQAGASIKNNNENVQLDSTSSNNLIEQSELPLPLLATASDLQNIKPIGNTSMGAYAYNGKWAIASSIEGDTYKKQLDAKIKWIEDLYKEKKERFVLNEIISEDEITNTLGIQYMYEKSSVYRDMVNIGVSLQSSPTLSTNGSVQFSLYDSTFSRLGSEKYYERNVFYVESPSMMNLNLSYDLDEGKIGFMVISPTGKLGYVGDTRSHYDDTITFPVDKGLWSFVTINESETGVIKGIRKINGNIAPSENFIVPIDIPSLKANDKTKYGPYYLNKDEAISVDISSWSGKGNIFVADEKEGEAFNHSVIMNKSPEGFAFVADESRYYYITVGNVNVVGNDTDVAVANIKGKITVNFKGTYQSPKQNKTTNLNPIETQKVSQNLTLIEKEYTKAELKTMNVSGVIVEVGSENVSIIKGGDTLKLQYYQSSDGEYIVDKQADMGGEIHELSLRRTKDDEIADGRTITITIPDNIKFEVIHVETSSGNIEVENCNTKILDTDSQSGEVKINGGTVDKMILAKTLTSNIQITGVTTHKDSFVAYLESDSGTATFKTLQPAANYMFHIDTKIDTYVSINGKRYSGGDFTINDNANNNIYFDSKNSTKNASFIVENMNK